MAHKKGIRDRLARSRIPGTVGLVKLLRYRNSKHYISLPALH
jgi:hypothetical protein